MKIADKQCKTCIYRSDSPLDLDKLESQVEDPYIKGSFVGYRICHHFQDESEVCCRGFWNRHKDNFNLGRIAQRLGFVEFVGGTDEQVDSLQASRL